MRCAALYLLFAAMRTAPIEMLDLLQEAANVYPLPRDAEIKRMSETYAKALGHFSLIVLQQALAEYIRTSSRGFPRPADLYPLAQSIAAAPKQNDLSDTYKHWYQTGMWGGCPVCDSILETIKGPKRIFTHHDAQRHREAAVPIIGPR